MFTGIIEQSGTLVSLTDRGGVRRITVEAPGLALAPSRRRLSRRLGVCLTALDVDPTYFHADLAQETLDRPRSALLAPGAKVNLELPTAAGSPLGGHVVQGHVDGTGAITTLDPVVPPIQPAFDRETTDWTLKSPRAGKRAPMDGPKGSVAIEGISLTIADFDGETITIAILPLTYWRTNLHTLAVGCARKYRGRCAGQIGRHAGEDEEARVRPHRRMARRQRLLKKFSHYCGCPGSRI